MSAEANRIFSSIQSLFILGYSCFFYILRARSFLPKHALPRNESWETDDYISHRLYTPLSESPPWSDCFVYIIAEATTPRHPVQSPSQNSYPPEHLISCCRASLSTRERHTSRPICFQYSLSQARGNQVYPTGLAALRTRYPAMDSVGALARPYYGFSRASAGRRPSHSTSRVLSCPANPR